MKSYLTRLGAAMMAAISMTLGGFGTGALALQEKAAPDPAQIEEDLKELRFDVAKLAGGQKALHTYAELCKKDNYGPACRELGFVFMYGWSGQKQDPGNGYRYLIKGCIDRDITACTFFNNFMAQRKGDAELRREMLASVEKICRAGSAEICFLAANQYGRSRFGNEKAEGLLQDREKATELLVAARPRLSTLCDRGRSHACFLRGAVAGTYYLSPDERGTAAQWYQKGCALDEPQSCSKFLDIVDRQRPKDRTLSTAEMGALAVKACDLGQLNCDDAGLAVLDGTGEGKGREAAIAYFTKGCEARVNNTRGDSCWYLARELNASGQYQKATAPALLGCQDRSDDACQLFASLVGKHKTVVLPSSAASAKEDLSPRCGWERKQAQKEPGRAMPACEALAVLLR